MFWRVELDKSGAILSCDAVADKGRNGGHVIFVEAETKPSACSAAKLWYEKRRLSRAASDKRRLERLRADGLCQSCSKPVEQRTKPFKGFGTKTWLCTDCRSRRRELVKARAAGDAPQGRPKKLPEEVIFLRSKKLSRLKVNMRTILRKFDELGSGHFRLWLVSEIERRESQVDFESESLSEAAE